MFEDRDEKYLIAFGNNLRKLRLEKGMSQEALANESDIPISQVSRIERGIVNTTVLTIKAISDSLRVHPKELFNF